MPEMYIKRSGKIHNRHEITSPNSHAPHFLKRLSGTDQHDTIPCSCASARPLLAPTYRGRAMRGSRVYTMEMRIWARSCWACRGSTVRLVAEPTCEGRVRRGWGLRPILACTRSSSSISSRGTSHPHLNLHAHQRIQTTPRSGTAKHVR